MSAKYETLPYEDVVGSLRACASGAFELVKTAVLRHKVTSDEPFDAKRHAYGEVSGMAAVCSVISTMAAALIDSGHFDSVEEACRELGMPEEYLPSCPAIIGKAAKVRKSYAGMVSAKSTGPDSPGDVE